MRQTFWEIDGEATRLRYDHRSEQIFVEEDSRSSGSYGGTRGQLTQIELTPAMVHDLMLALCELKGILEAERMERGAGKTMGKAA